MRTLRHILFGLALSSLMAAPALADSSSSAEPVRVATAPTSKRMTVHHETQQSTAKARHRGAIGLDPTAGSADKIIRASRDDSMSSFLSAEKTRLRKASEKLKAETYTRKASAKVAPGVAAQLETFNPGPLSFMEEPPAPAKAPKRSSKKK